MEKSVHQDKIYLPRLRAENISCIGGTANTSFQEACNYFEFY